MEIQLTIVDIGVLGILMISGLIAAYRGFLKETLTVSAWLLAAVAAVFFWPVAKPFARSLVEPKVVADILALVGVFLMLLIPVSFVSFRLSELVRDSRAGPLDRSMGFVFGLARGLLVVGLGYLVFASLAPPKTHPKWVREARLLPVIKGTADVIRSVSGGKAKEAKDTSGEENQAEEPKPTVIAKKDETKPADKKPQPDADPDKKEAGEVKDTPYDDGDRRALDQLVRSTAKP
jgi:membrane protein required for colicin V production